MYFYAHFRAEGGHNLKKNLLFKKNYAVELARAIRGAQGAAQLRTLLSDYHEHDIAEALRAFQREHAGTGIRIVYKIAK